MAKTRVVNTKFWTDNYIIGLSPKFKLIFLHLLSNPLTEISGVYELTREQVSFDAGLTADDVDAALAQFEADAKVRYQDGWIAVRNWIKNQSHNPNVKIGIGHSMGKAPPWAQAWLDHEPIEVVAEKPVLKLVPAKKDVTEIQTVFAHWQQVHNKQASKLDSKREKRIRSRLKDFTADQLCRAIDGSLKDSWLMGKDPKSTRPYVDVHTLFRDNAQVERLMDMAKPRVVAAVSASSGGHDWSNIPEIKKGAVIEDGAKYQKQVGI